MRLSGFISKRRPSDSPPERALTPPGPGPGRIWLQLPQPAQPPAGSAFPRPGPRPKPQSSGRRSDSGRRWIVFSIGEQDRALFELPPRPAE